MAIIDLHTHVYPGPRLHPQVLAARAMIRKKLIPLAHLRHDVQIFSRKLPPLINRWVDEVGVAVLSSGLILESSVQDHQESMQQNHVDRALVVAFPPLISNDFVLRTVKNDSRLIPAVTISPCLERVEEKIRSFHSQGVRFLKLHPLADGVAPSSGSYRQQIRVASDLGWNIVIHTGRIQTQFFKNPDFGDVVLFLPWLKEFTETRFIFAHMGIHDANKAVQLIEGFPNVSVLTSYQPQEAIVNAVRTLGSERCLYASDWPLLGDNMAVAIARIESARSQGQISELQAKQILGQNALRLLTAAGVP